MQKRILDKLLPIFYIIIFILVGIFIYNIINNNSSEEIIIEDTEIELEYGSMEKIDATIETEKDSGSKITYISSEPTLVTVDKDGYIHANSNAEGEAIITVKSEETGKSKDVIVKVNKVESIVQVNAIEIDKEVINLVYQQTDKINTKVMPENATNKGITWESSNSTLVTVDNGGNVRAVANKDGQAILTVKTKEGNLTKKVTVNVAYVKNNKKVTGISLNKSTITLKYNEQTKLVATVSPNDATNKSVTWESSNPSLVSVDQNGNIKTITNKSGEALVTVKTNDGGYSSSTKVIVKKVDNTIKVTGVKIDNGNQGTIYLNKNNSIQLNATVQPSNVTNKSVTWVSSDNSIATVDNNGNVTANKIGNVNITVKTNDGKFTNTYNLVIKQKVIVVITASAGVRMNNWFKNYTSINKNTYSSSLNTLNYIYKSGSGFEFQYGEGLEKAKNHINSIYSNNKNYIDLSIFFTLTGNSIKNLTCDGIKTSGEYSEIANKYNNAVQQFINLGYKNTKGYVISHSPLNTKYAIKNFPTQSANAKIVYSHKEEACQQGYRSAYKYWLSNQRMKNTLNSGNYINLKFIDNYSNFVVLINEANKTFTWLKNNNGITYDNLYKTTDGLHWDESTTKIYMQLAFDTAAM